MWVAFTEDAHEELQSQKNTKMKHFLSYFYINIGNINSEIR